MRKPYNHGASHCIVKSVDLESPSENERDASAAYVRTLFSAQLYETPIREAVRENATRSLEILVTNVITQIGLLKNLSIPDALSSGGRLLLFGSYRLGVHGPNTDMDALVITPSFVSRDEWFQIFPLYLRSHVNVVPGSVVALPDAFVPVIKLVWKGSVSPEDMAMLDPNSTDRVQQLDDDSLNIDIDLLFCRMDVPKVPSSLQILSPRAISLAMSDPRGVPSLNGVRVAEAILAIVGPENMASFCDALRGIKAWACARGVYGSSFGYLGGVHCAVLTAYILRMYPKATPYKILYRFFCVFSNWSWPSPVRLIETPRSHLQLKQWVSPSRTDQRVSLEFQPDVMPILSPCFPVSNVGYTASLGTLRIISKELVRGFEILSKGTFGTLPNTSGLKINAVRNQKATMERESAVLNELFEPTDFPSLYPMYLAVCVCYHDSSDDRPGHWTHDAWSAWVESRLRRLPVLLEDVYIDDVDISKLSEKLTSVVQQETVKLKSYPTFVPPCVNATPLSSPFSTSSSTTSSINNNTTSRTISNAKPEGTNATAIPVQKAFPTDNLSSITSLQVPSRITAVEEDPSPCKASSTSTLSNAPDNSTLSSLLSPNPVNISSGASTSTTSSNHSQSTSTSASARRVFSAAGDSASVAGSVRTTKSVASSDAHGSSNATTNNSETPTPRYRIEAHLHPDPWIYYSPTTPVDPAVLHSSIPFSESAPCSSLHKETYCVYPGSIITGVTDILGKESGPLPPKSSLVSTYLIGVRIVDTYHAGYRASRRLNRKGRNNALLTTMRPNPRNVTRSILKYSMESRKMEVSSWAQAAASIRSNNTRVFHELDISNACRLWLSEVTGAYYRLTPSLSNALLSRLRLLQDKLNTEKASRSNLPSVSNTPEPSGSTPGSFKSAWGTQNTPTFTPAAVPTNLALSLLDSSTSDPVPQISAFSSPTHASVSSQLHPSASGATSSSTSSSATNALTSDAPNLLKPEAATTVPAFSLHMDDNPPMSSVITVSNALEDDVSTPEETLSGQSSRRSDGMRHTPPRDPVSASGSESVSDTPTSVASHSPRLQSEPSAFHLSSDSEHDLESDGDIRSPHTEEDDESNAETQDRNALSPQGEIHQSTEVNSTSIAPSTNTTVSMVGSATDPNISRLESGAVPSTFLPFSLPPPFTPPSFDMAAMGVLNPLPLHHLLPTFSQLSAMHVMPPTNPSGPPKAFIPTSQIPPNAGLQISNQHGTIQIPNLGTLTVLQNPYQLQQTGAEAPAFHLPLSFPSTTLSQFADQGTFPANFPPQNHPVRKDSTSSVNSYSSLSTLHLPANHGKNHSPNTRDTSLNSKDQHTFSASQTAAGLPPLTPNAFPKGVNNSPSLVPLSPKIPPAPAPSQLLHVKPLSHGGSSSNYYLPKSGYSSHKKLDELSSIQSILPPLLAPTSQPETLAASKDPLSQHPTSIRFLSLSALKNASTTWSQSVPNVSSVSAPDSQQFQPSFSDAPSRGTETTPSQPPQSSSATGTHNTLAPLSANIDPVQQESSHNTLSMRYVKEGYPDIPQGPDICIVPIFAGSPELSRFVPMKKVSSKGDTGNNETNKSSVAEADVKFSELTADEAASSKTIQDWLYLCNLVPLGSKSKSRRARIARH